MSRLADLMEKGYITRILSEEDKEVLENKSEQELLELGYLTHIGFDGDDETIEEVLPVVEEDKSTNEPVEDEPIVEDEPGEASDDENFPVVEEDKSTDEPVEDEPIVEE